MMKNVLIKVSALLLIVWYSMSIIGFGVHTCSGSGRIFVTSFVDGMTCENIHPEDLCDPHSCCHHHDDEDYDVMISAKSCCSNDYQMLQFAGALSSDDNRINDGFRYSEAPFFSLYASVDEYLEIHSEITAYVHKPGSGLCRKCDRQAAFGIWRI